MIEIDADTFTVVSDKKCIPTGEMRPVGGTPFDLREPKRMGDGMALTDKDEQLTYGNGYDHNFNLNGEGLRFAVEVTEPTTGRVMQVYTDMPAVQFYAGNGLESVNPAPAAATTTSTRASAWRRSTRPIPSTIPSSRTACCAPARNTTS